MSSYYKDGKEIIVIEDVSFTSLDSAVTPNAEIGNKQLEENSNQDNSITPVHISSDEEDNVDIFSPMILHSQDITDDDDIFAVKQIFPVTTTTTAPGATTTTISPTNTVTRSTNPDESDNSQSPVIFIKPRPKITKTRKSSTTTNNTVNLNCTKTNDSNNDKILTKKQQNNIDNTNNIEGAKAISKKEMVKRKRSQEKELARQQKELEKENKRLKRQETLRANGKFQFDEIVVNLENSLYKSPIGQSIVEIIQEEDKYGSKIANFKVLNTNDNKSNSTNKYVRNSVEWTREIPGEECSGFVWTAVVYSGDDFYDFIVDYKNKLRLHQTKNSLIYKLVEGLRLYQKPWINEFQQKRDESLHFGVKYVKSKPRILLLVAEWSKSLSSKNKSNRGKSGVLITEHDLMTISNKLYVEYDVEVQCFDSVDRVAKELKGITRYLATKPYNKDKNSLSFLKKARVPMTMDFYNDPKRELRRTWMRMLMQINGVSAKIALNISSKYPTFRTLYNEYHNNNLSINERKNLLANIISDNGRSCYTLSSRIFTFMTEDDHKRVL